MNYPEAKNIAIKYWKLFKEVSMPGKCKVAGGVRREKKDPHDIEIVCVPQTFEKPGKGLFDLYTIHRIQKFIDLVNSFPRVKGSAEGKLCQLILPEGINLDLFMASEINFGLILMIRTGSADFSKRMVTEIRPRGFYCYEGLLYNSKHEVIPVPDEESFFTITGLPYLKPNMRIK